MLLGQILIRKNLISHDQLERVIDQQNRNRKKLGELLLQNRLIASEQLEEALKEQYWRRNGFWVIDDTCNHQQQIVNMDLCMSQNA